MYKKLDHFGVHQKQTQRCKLTILQFQKKKKKPETEKEKKNLVIRLFQANIRLVM